MMWLSFFLGLIAGGLLYYAFQSVYQLITQKQSVYTNNWFRGDVVEQMLSRTYDDGFETGFYLAKDFQEYVNAHERPTIH